MGRRANTTIEVNTEVQETEEQENAQSSSEASTEATEENTTDTAAATEPTQEKPQPPPEVKPVEKKPVKIVPHYISFFEQYIMFIEQREPQKAIKALNNCIKSMLSVNTNEAFKTVYELYKEKKSMLDGKVILQSVAILPANERATVEVVTTIFHLILTNPKSPINFEMARGIVKSDQFINWCAKKVS